MVQDPSPQSAHAAPPVPALSWEERQWASRLAPDMVSRRVRERHAGPYRAAVVPRIAEREVSMPGDVLALADDASAEIARFDAEMGAEIAPFGAILLRTESAASSRIEHLTASAKTIALAELGDTDRRNATEIVANTRAMQAAIDLADRLDSDAILAMHQALMLPHQSDIAGQWRSEQVWIGGSGYGPHLADFVPPHHEHVPAAMDDLIRYVRRDDVSTLVQAAIAHAQFETIHPFPDGNGRTGRALIHSMMRGKGLTRQITVPVSAGLLTDTARYFSTLDSYRTGDPVPIVELIAQASFAAISNGRELVDELREIRTRWREVVTARSDAAVWRLADVLLRQPVIAADLVVAQVGVTPTAAHHAIGQLVDAGILTEFSGKTRNRRWLAAEVLSALDDFAARAGRRRNNH
ncbi:MAG: Fic family protein [Micromonosporaceae bacterium]